MNKGREYWKIPACGGTFPTLIQALGLVAEQKLTWRKQTWRRIFRFAGIIQVYLGSTIKISKKRQLIQSAFTLDKIKIRVDACPPNWLKTKGLSASSLLSPADRQWKALDKLRFSREY